jgi:hypothetical protein
MSSKTRGLPTRNMRTHSNEQSTTVASKPVGSPGHQVWLLRTMRWSWCLWLVAVVTGQAQLTVDFLGSTTVSPSSPSIQLSVHNSGATALSIGGVNLFTTIGGGTTGPTMGTGVGVGVDLLTGTLFSGRAPFGHFPIGTPDPRNQRWGVLSSPAAVLDAGATLPLATITFDSFPLGAFTLDFSGTSFADPIGNSIAIGSLPTGSPTVVPEVEHCSIAAGFGCFLLALARGFRSRVKTCGVNP